MTNLDGDDLEIFKAYQQVCKSVEGVDAGIATVALAIAVGTGIGRFVKKSHQEAILNHAIAEMRKTVEAANVVNEKMKAEDSVSG